MKAEQDPTRQFICFQAFGESFGVDILDVREINSMPEITPIPEAPGFIEGIIDLRGEIIPVVDFRKFFHREPNPDQTGRRIMIIKVEENSIGFIVDSVSRIIKIQESALKSPPPMVKKNIHSQYIKGVLKDRDGMLIIIDPSKMFSSDELKHLRETGEL